MFDENAAASAFPVATRLELVDKSCCGVSERTTIKWINYLHFESRFSGTVARCRELQLLSRDREDERATRSAGACAACRETRPAAPRDWFRGVPEWYVAGVDTRGRTEGRPYPWSQSRQGVNS